MIDREQTMAVPVLVNAATHSLPKLQIKALLTVPPQKVTEPRRVRQVLMSDTDTVMNSKPFHGCYQIVLYYEKLNEHECDEFLAGWIVESLGRVLVEYPLLSGRLQRKEVEVERAENKELLEIVSNDSGVRLYEALFPMELSEFLGLSEKEHLESELVFWKEIDEHNPEFSPLFYVQVTQFECGGYSIGISCSLLLGDVLVIENFLKKWVEIHNNMLPQNEEIKAPLFYHPLLIQNNYEPDPVDLISRAPSKNGIHTMVFKVATKDLNFNIELWRELAMLCVVEAEQKLHKKMGSNFYVFVKESPEVIKIRCHSKNGTQVLDLKLKNQIVGATWNDFGDYDVTFHGGNKPILVSRWIGSLADGHVMVIPRPEENFSAGIIVSFPFEKQTSNGLIVALLMMQLFS